MARFSRPLLVLSCVVVAFLVAVGFAAPFDSSTETKSVAVSARATSLVPNAATSYDIEQAFRKYLLGNYIFEIQKSEVGSYIQAVEVTAIVDYVNAVEAQEAADRAAALAAQQQQMQQPPQRSYSAPASAPTPVPSSGGGSNGGFLDCVRNRESRGDYSIHNAGGSGASGAYQFMPGTWNSIAQSSGRGDLVGMDPAQASPADQDAMAQALYAQQGAAPWGGGC